jgi:putative ABC transport system permease protein
MPPLPWWIGALVRLYPRDYRERQGIELARAMHACLERERLTGASTIVTSCRITADAIATSVLVRQDIRASRLAPRASGDSFMQSLLYDLRHAFRMLRRAPLFSALVVATLALAIGANTAIFSVVNGVLLRQLPYRQPERLVTLYEGVSSRPTPFGFSAPDLAAFRERARGYDALGAFRTVEFELSGVSQPERVTAARISASLVDVLGVGPALGRGFTEAEDTSRQPVAILSDGLWRRAFGADRSIIGKPVSLDRRPYTIVGVMPRGFTFPNRGPHINNVPADVFVPISFSPAQLTAFGSNFNNSVIGRLRPGVTVDQAASEAAAILKQIIADVYPATLRDIPLVVTTRPMRVDLVGRVERVLVVLLAAVGVLLLIACADIACLMLTRAASRAREIAIRSALGARRGRVVRLMLVETGVLAAIGAAGGLALAWIAERGLLASIAADLPRVNEVGIDGRVLAFTALSALAATLICGLLPAFDASRADSSGALKEGSRSATPGVRQQRILSGLVTLQFACAIVLLASGLLLIRSFAKVIGTDPGFRSDHVVSIATSLPFRGYPDGPAVRGFYGRLLERVAAVPGAAEVGAATDLPLTVRDRRAFTIENPSAAALRQSQAVANDYVMGRYFEALGVRIVRGRALSASDTLSSEPVVVINETLATGYWPGEDPVGRRIAWGGAQSHQPWMRVVGVVGDIKQSGLTGRTEPQTWQPWAQVSDTMLANNAAGIFRGVKLMVRTNVAPLSLVSAIREEVRRIDPALPVTGVQTLDDIVGASAATQRFNATLLGAFAGVALLLAAVGIGGVLAISVSQRKQEIGIRLALGADAGDVVRMVIRQGMTLVVAGLIVGLPAAFAATRLLRTLLFETAPHDAVSFAAATVILCAVALVACAAPALRASRVSPITALRID